MMFRLCGLIVAAAFLVIGPAMASEKVVFPNENFWPDAKSLKIPGVLTKPKGKGPFPAVVLLPNCGGPTKWEFTTYWPKYLNKLGYVTLNVDNFTPRKHKKCSKKFIPKRKDVTQDAYGALTYLAGLPFIDKHRIGVLGLSKGASVINWFSGRGNKTPAGLDFAASVNIYGPTCKSNKVGDGMVPLMIIMGDKEKGAEICRALPAHKNLTVHIFPGVYHAFDQPSAKRTKKGKLKKDVVGNIKLYNPAAARKAQELVKAYFAEKLSEEAASKRESAAQPAATTPDSAPTPERLPKVGNKDPNRAVERRDTDGDNKVSAAEWDKSPNVFAKIDGDGDGYLTAQEFHDHWMRRQ
jgi:dienelactone hydrolase